MIAGARLVDGARRAGASADARLVGLKLVAGMAKGEAVFHQPRVVVEHTVAEDTEAERPGLRGLPQDARADRRI